MTISLPASIWPNVSGAVAVLVRHAKPEHVHRRAVVLALESGFLAHDEWRPSQPTTRSARIVECPVRRPGDQADNAPVLLDQVCRLGLHAQVESFVALAVLGQEVEEVPLRHQRNEFAVGWQMAKIDHLNVFGADLRGQRFDFLMRQLQELVDQAEFKHQFERRRMNRVAAEIAKEIGVLLQHHDPDAGARQQESEHHSGGAAAGDAALRRDR